MMPRVSERAARAWAYEGPRPEVQALVPTSARRVLDLGCASGAVGEALRRRQGAEVVGVERDPGYARDAEGRLDRVVCADLDELARRPGLADDLGRFDALVAADVLEHLVEPDVVLRAFAALLEPGGTAVISLPNVRHWTVLRQLAVRGSWPRDHEGLFDRTHLRWFTLHDAIGLLHAAGLEPVEVRRTTRPGARLPWLVRVRGPRAFTAFQHVLAARPR
jgi:2-polyprenyl-3-methyl-5-hydroxy-6-metoxy-1,4-benzoquinol methylase